jgi:hypothetical protein
MANATLRYQEFTSQKKEEGRRKKERRIFSMPNAQYPMPNLFIFFKF